MFKPAILEDYLELVTYGFTNPMPDADEGPWKITAKDVIGGEINFNTARRTTQEAFDTKLTKKSRPKIGDVLLTKDGTLGRLAIVKQEDICINQSVAVLRPNEKILPEYLFYLLSTPEYQKQMIGDSEGTVIKHIYITRVGKMEVDIPSIKEQRGRLKHLFSIDGKIKLNRQTNQTLEQIAQAIFKSWFVDFDPVKAKIQAKKNGQDPELAAICAISGLSTSNAASAEEQLKGLDKAALQQLKTTAALFPDTLIESDFGEIPEGWEVKALSTWGDVICGKTPSKKRDEYYGGGIPFIKIPDMHGNMYVTRTIDSLTNEGAETQKKKMLSEGSVCVSCIATVGQVLITSEDSYANQQINSIVPNKRHCTSYLYFSMLGLYDYLHDLASGGSATLNLNTGNFSKIQILSPSDKLINRFDENVETLFERILANYQQQDVLIEIKDSLLPRLLSGELETNNAA